VDVIKGAPDHERGTVPILEDTGLIREQPIAMDDGNRALTPFRTVHEMDEVLHEGLRHRRALRLCRPFRA
jgi:hypothetical protein